MTNINLKEFSKSRRSSIGVLAVIAFCLFGLIAEVAAEALWTNRDWVNRRSCPSTDCGELGKLFFREKINVLERRGQWGRISRYYDGACVDGRSAHLKSGRRDCTVDNGFRQDGSVAEWVYLPLFAAQRPTDPARSATGREAVVAQSDDFRKHRAAFVAAANALISRGRCTDLQIQEHGGFIKSTTTYRNRPVYFIYCGGFARSNRWYIDVSSGRIFQYSWRVQSRMPLMQRR